MSGISKRILGLPSGPKGGPGAWFMHYINLREARFKDPVVSLGERVRVKVGSQEAWRTVCRAWRIKSCTMATKHFVLKISASLNYDCARVVRLGVPGNFTICPDRIL